MFQLQTRSTHGVSGTYEVWVVPVLETGTRGDTGSLYPTLEPLQPCNRLSLSFVFVETPNSQFEGHRPTQDPTGL